MILTRILERILNHLKERNHRKNLRELGISPKPLRFKTIVQ